MLHVTGRHLLVFARLITLVHNSCCLECYSCLSATDPYSCNQTTRCGQNEVCFTDRKGSATTFGCATYQQCSLGATSGVFVGRDLTSRQSSNCHECCSTDLCNANLCAHSQPSACVDDETVDCPKLNTIFGICADVYKAKLVCAKFCDLCSLVDGQWSPWSSWSVCSVTCENGNETRQRACTNPAPANGGLFCVGESTETKLCSLEPCPVHGGWSTWADWGSCSVSCDVGMQFRERGCTNPPPARYGDHCFGYSREDMICMPRACADGSWSQWEPWSACSDSCGGGVKTRERYCNNPPPSLIGRACTGNSGQSTTCNRDQCPDKRIAFSASYMSSGSAAELIFSRVLINYGNGYSSSTGRFTCTVPGLYYFSAILSKTHRVVGDYVFCFIQINSQSVVGSVESSTITTAEYSFTITGIFHLNRNDYVNIGTCHGANTLETQDWSSFNGFLILAD